MRLTKKKLKLLESSLSTDDILYEKFRRLHIELNKEWARFAKAKTIARVVQKKYDYTMVLQVVEEHHTPDGIVIVVK